MGIPCECGQVIQIDDDGEGSCTCGRSVTVTPFEKLDKFEQRMINRAVLEGAAAWAQRHEQY